MGAYTEYYVDPGSGSDGNAGTSDGAAWATLDHALNNITRDTTNGDRINIKAGTALTLSANLDTGTYGSGSNSAPLVIQGYTSTAGDGGICVINGSSNTYHAQGWNSANYWNLVDLEFTSMAAFGGTSIFLNDGVGLYHCYFHDLDGYVRVDNSGHVFGCRFENIDASYGLLLDSIDAIAYGNFFADGANTFSTSAIRANNDHAIVERNIISLTGNAHGIEINGDEQMVIGNSILSAGGTGSGIVIINQRFRNIIMNNLVEGFSGTGGHGLECTSTAHDQTIYRSNAVYNCATAYDSSFADQIWLSETDNETLGASPFAKSGSNNYSNRFTYFSPADTGNVRGQAYGG